MKLFNALCWTYAGVICQLVGLGWDIMMHRANPHSMGSEDILTLSNPSHLLIGLGLVLVAGGAVAQLMRNPVHLRSATLMSTVGCLVLVLLSVTDGGAGIPLVGAMMASGHSHNAADEHALPSGTVLTLQAVLKGQGTGAALTKLEEMTVSDPALLAQAHDLAHALGKYSFKHYGGDTATAFSHCRETFQSGCYHGVMEAHFEANPTVDRVALGKLCSGGILADEVPTLRFQCLHGLGHGLTFHFEHDLVKALAHCDYLPGAWDQGSCYGGAFMENAILFWQQRTGGTGAVHEHVKDHKPFINAEDPLYPCTILEDRYLHECYQMQTSNVLTLNGHNFTEAFKVCDNAQARWRDVCYHSMGRDVSGYTLRDSARSIELCMLGSPAHRAFCFQGAVRNFIHMDWKTDKAMPFCASVPSEGKDACFRAIGEELIFIHTDAARRATECAKAQEPFVAVCARGARAG